MGRVCGTYRGRGEVYAAVGWENLTNISLGRPRHRWEDNILECILRNGWEDVDWIDLT
jgi:hypothetical protein